MLAKILRRLRRAPAPSKAPEDLSATDRKLLEGVSRYTMTSLERQMALLAAVDYVVDNNLAGSFVECGVWRGGSAMLMARRLQARGGIDRVLHLFDTFEGMPPPSAHDVGWDGQSADVLLAREERDQVSHLWAWASLDDVKANLARTGYPAELLHFVPGKVEDTLPASAPERIALLRLDTDWYESTAHELTHLYDRVIPRGVIIIDDYGHWQGARRAVDEFLARLEFRPFVARIDYSGRVWIKP